MDDSTPASDLIPNLYAYALAKARESAANRELPTVALEAGVDYSWLSKFACDKFPGASYEKVHKLARHYFNRERQAALDAGQPAPVWPFITSSPTAAPAAPAP